MLDSKAVRRYHGAMVRRIIFALLLASLVGLGAYGYRNREALEATPLAGALAPCAAWARQQADALGSAFRKSGLYASYQKGLHDYQAQRQRRPAEGTKAPEDPKAKLAKLVDRAGVSLQAKPAPAAAAPAPAPAVLTEGQRIANGHAFGKHAQELGMPSREAMAAHIDRIIRTAGLSNTRRLARGRTAYWDEASGTAVIVDPSAEDGGTAFKPRGRKYFESLR